MIQIESDALTVGQALGSNSLDDSLFGLIISDCLDLINQITGVIFSHLLRSVNRVAHYMFLDLQTF